MNNKKGFTIIELIISISILIIIFTLTTMNFNKIFDRSEDKSYIEYTNKIKSAADFYLSDNNSLLTELNTNKGFVIISIKQLKDAGLLDSDLINPETKKNVLDDELVLVSLDESGLHKFVYPVGKVEEYLQTITKILNYGDAFNCLSDLDTINLGLIDKNGDLITKYFSNNPSYINCDINNIDTKKVGNHVITYSYINTEGIKKSAKRNFIVMDNINPTVTNVDYSPKEWTSRNIKISATVNDNESGIAAFAVNLNKCDNFKTTNSNTINQEVSENGVYSVCAKDGSGNITESKITISNIDKIKPTVTVSKSTNDYVTSLTITGNITDNESQIAAYAINQTNDVTKVSWTNIASTKTKTVTQSITANGTYYVWAKDVVGNINKTPISINNIGTLMSATFNTNELSSSVYSGAYNTGSTIKKIVSVTTNTGQISSSSFSGTVISYTVGNGTTYNQNYTTTCSSSPSTISRTSTTNYYCPSDYTLSGSKCTKTTSASSKQANSTVTCASGKYVESVNRCRIYTDTRIYDCPSGYTSSGSGSGMTCTKAITTSPSTNAANVSCPSGWTMSSANNCYQNTVTPTTKYTCPNPGPNNDAVLKGTQCRISILSKPNCSKGSFLDGYGCVTKDPNCVAGFCYIFESASCPSGYSMNSTTKWCYKYEYYDATSSKTCSNGATYVSSVDKCRIYTSDRNYSCSSGTLSGSTCYKCSSGYTYTGGTCKKTETTGPVALCPSGWSMSSANNCYQNLADPVTKYSCSSGTLSGTTCYSCTSGTLSGTNCVSTQTAPYTTSYSCGPGYTMVGSACYSCSTGSLNGTSCEYPCTGSYNYYKYQITVQYII